MTKQERPLPSPHYSFVTFSSECTLVLTTVMQNLYMYFKKFIHGRPSPTSCMSRLPEHTRSTSTEPLYSGDELSEIERPKTPPQTTINTMQDVKLEETPPGSDYRLNLSNLICHLPHRLDTQFYLYLPRILASKTQLHQR